MGKALYRSYRSKSLDEVIGQEHITETLKNSLKKKTYVHAYLLTGPRGVGKTSVARILAHAVNDSEYPPKTPFVDIIEIDAASNRRIDEIRELRERVTIAPTSLQYKVYIIDEVHMLTKEAFNALLKTLEEPPEHVIFILATTDVHKVPDTIVSRCVRFNFRPISNTDIKNHLLKISKIEKIMISNEALEVIAENSDGSFRDAIALLDMLSDVNGEIDKNMVVEILGLGSDQIINELLASVASNDIVSILRNLDVAYEHGVNEVKLHNQLISTLRNKLINQPEDMDRMQILKLLDDLLLAGNYNDVRNGTEIALLKNSIQGVSTKTVKSKQPRLNEGEITKPSVDTKIEHEIETPILNDKIESKENISLDFWEKTLDELKKNNRSLYSIARMAKVNSDGNILRLSFGFEFHYKQMNLDKNNSEILAIAKKYEPEINDIEVSLSTTNEDKQVNKESIKNINNIFGTSEVLES